MVNRVWIRDSMTWTTDCGSADGFYSFDLLWRARTGKGQGTGEDAPPLQQLASAAPVDVHPDLRAEDAQIVPTTIDLQGAYLKRIRMEYGLIFSEQTGAIAPNYEGPLMQGWYEGLLIAPWTHFANRIAPNQLGDPQEEVQAQALDWIWWDRKYVRSLGYKTVTTAVPLTSGHLVYSGIDTRNSRRFDQYGSSLYWNIGPTGAPPSPALPATGSTINGGTASWSILLELPG